MPISTVDKKQCVLADGESRLIAQETSQLYGGSKFNGTQKSGRNSYEVNVDIQVKF